MSEDVNWGAGKPPVPPDDDRRKDLKAKLAEIRKSAETVANMCLGTIVATVLKAGSVPSGYIKVATTAGVLGALAGLVGATMWSSSPDASRYEELLQDRYNWRARLRYVALFCLVVGLYCLLHEVWIKK